MTALLLDVGNSRLKWGVLENGRIRRTGHITQQHIREQGLAALTAKLPRGVDTVFASNVAGASFATRLSGVIGMHCGCDVHFARAEKAACGVTNRYTQPRRMGVDRWVAMLGAWAECQAACLVVDAGTAVTLDAIDDAGQHLGGQIFPGMALMAGALAGETSELPDLGKRIGAAATGLGLFAGNTRQAMEQGVMNAVIGAIERAVYVLEEAKIDATIFLTGGDASRILQALEYEALHRPHLVLAGLAHRLEHAE